MSLILTYLHGGKKINKMELKLAIAQSGILSVLEIRKLIAIFFEHIL